MICTQHGKLLRGLGYDLLAGSRTPCACRGFLAVAARRPASGPLQVEREDHQACPRARRYINQLSAAGIKALAEAAHELLCSTGCNERLRQRYIEAPALPTVWKHCARG